MSKWFDGVMCDFIKKGNLNGILTDNQVYAFRKNMIKEVNSYMKTETVIYSYTYNDWKFTIIDNRFYLSNDIIFEEERKKRDINRLKLDIDLRIEMIREGFGDLERNKLVLTELKEKLKVLEN